MSTYEECLASFTAWPHTSPTPKQMARAGFIHMPTSEYPDRVICKTCKDNLCDWRPEDDPKIELHIHHLRCSPLWLVLATAGRKQPSTSDIGFFDPSHNTTIFPFSGYIARYAPPAVLKRRHWQNLPTRSMRIRALLNQPPSLPPKLYHYLELDSPPVLPKHRHPTCHRSDLTTVFLRALPQHPQSRHHHPRIERSRPRHLHTLPSQTYRQDMPNPHI